MRKLGGAFDAMPAIRRWGLPEGTEYVMERKTPVDFLQSFTTGKLERQLRAMVEAAYLAGGNVQVVLIVEGVMWTATESLVEGDVIRPRPEFAPEVLRRNPRIEHYYPVMKHRVLSFLHSLRNSAVTEFRNVLVVTPRSHRRFLDLLRWFGNPGGR